MEVNSVGSEAVTTVTTKQRRIVRQKFIDISEELTASIFRIEE
jgi:hypothetical protein